MASLSHMRRRHNQAGCVSTRRVGRACVASWARPLAEQADEDRKGQQEGHSDRREEPGEEEA
jgi:hypothetical protein